MERTGDPPSQLARLPADCRAEVIAHGDGRATTFPTARPDFAAACQALSDEWGRRAMFVGGGGSIPVAHTLQQGLGMDVILAGFGQDGARIHSPNEKYEWRSFHQGIRSWVRVLAALAG